MTKEVKRYKVTIAGESYFLVSDEPEERILNVARYVDKQICHISQSGHADDLQRLAVLVALQSASKMMHYSDLLQVYQSHNEKMIDLINQQVTLANP